MNKHILLAAVAAIGILALIALWNVTAKRDAAIDTNVKAGGVSTPPVLLPSTSGEAQQPPQSLAEARSRLKERIAELEKMTQADWDKLREKESWRPAKLDIALARHKGRLVKLDTMTEEQWQVDQQKRRLRAPQGPERQPDIAPAPAAPEKP